MTAPTEPEAAGSKRRSTVAVIVGAIVVLAALAIVGVVLLNRNNREPSTGDEALPTIEASDTPTPSADASPPSTTPSAAASSRAPRTPAPRTSAPKPPTGCQNCQMTGDGVTYLVGGTGPKTARAGTWRGDGGTDCLWTISSDPAGTQVISQKQALGPTELLLRPNTYFQSTGCQPWTWVSA